MTPAAVNPSTANKTDSILVIEDEPDILEMLQYNLRREGYRVWACQDGEGGLETARDELPDLVLLDLMLPRLSGLEVCRKLKSDPITKNISVIMVTAKGEEEDVVAGLEAGADDYISKPFSPKILVARIRAALRRTPTTSATTSNEGRIELPGVTIDLERHEVAVEGSPVVFTATEFRLLHFMAKNRGRVFTRNQLLDRVIGHNAMVIDRNIDVHIGAVRKKLGRHRGLIETIRGVGYRFKD